MRSTLFWIFAGLGLALSYATLKLRYAWYISNDDARFLDAGYLLVAGAIIALWFFFPSRVLVALLAAILFVFPTVFRPETFVWLDLSSALFFLVPVMLLVCATHWRRISRKNQVRNELP